MPTKNLNHSKIAKVKVLVFGEEAVTYLQSLKLKRSHKLIIHKNDKWPTIRGGARKSSRGGVSGLELPSRIRELK